MWSPACSPGGKHQILSVLVTAFVGSHTEVMAPIAQQDPLPVEEPPSSPEPDREPLPSRPHLTINSSVPVRLPHHKMLSTTMQVVNDGDVKLEDVVIIADIPTSLEHHFGQTVHFSIGSMNPQEVRDAWLLLKPVSPGPAVVTLKVVDGAEMASDINRVNYEVTTTDLPEPPRVSDTVKNAVPEDVRPRFTRRKMPSSSFLQTDTPAAEKSDSQPGL